MRRNLPIAVQYSKALYALNLLKDGYNFTSAADQIGMNRTTLSKMITVLEKQVCRGVKLVKVQTKSVSLTHAGLQLSQLFQPIGQISEQIQDAIQQLQQSESGLLRIAVPVAYGQEKLFPLLKQIKQKFSDLRFQILYYEGTCHPQNNAIDLTIVIQKKPPYLGLRCRVIDQVEVGLYASQTYLEKTAIPSHPDQLQEHQCILTDSQRHNTKWTFTHPQKATVWVDLSQQNESQSQEAQRREWIQAGYGIGLLPHYLAKNQSDLVPILTDWTLKNQGPNQVYLCYFRELTRTPSVEFFISQLMMALRYSTK